MKIIVAGDFCPQKRVAELIGKSDYSTVFGKIKDILSEADYSILNFECPIKTGNEKPIIKQGPNLSCSEKGLDALKWAGFNGVTLANNHLYDFGDEGIMNLLAKCKSNGIDIVGGGSNLQEAEKSLVLQIDGKQLSIINCCEHEFSIATESQFGANPLNPVQQYYAIKEAKEQFDYVFVIVHGGHEHCQFPSLRMQELYRFFIDAGADAVINHHQHCYSGYEIYKRKPIFYGLGNLCFDGNRSGKTIWNEGYMVLLSIENELKFKLIPYTQCKDNAPCVVPMQGDDLISFNTRIKELNEIINDKERLVIELNKWYKKSFKELELALTPYNNRFLKGLWRRGLLPSFLPKKKLVELMNLIECESHHDRLIVYLKEKIYG